MFEVSVTMAWLLGAPLLLLMRGVEGHWSAALWLAVYLATVGVVARAQGPLGQFRTVSALGCPLFALLFVAITLCSAFGALRGAPITWRGRQISR